MEKLKRYDLNCNIFDVYEYDGLSMQELLCQFYTKINECVDFSNSTLDLCEWLVNEGLNQEVALKLTTWLNDGTLENIINVTVFENLNKKIDNVSSQLEHIKHVDLRQFPRQNCEKNDTNRIQRAIDYINDTTTSSFFDKGYGTLYIPAGVYDVETLNLSTTQRTPKAHSLSVRLNRP